MSVSKQTIQVGYQAGTFVDRDTISTLEMYLCSCRKKEHLKCTRVLNKGVVFFFFRVERPLLEWAGMRIAAWKEQ